MVGKTVDDIDVLIKAEIEKIDSTSIERKDLQIQMVELLEEILVVLTELNDKIKDKS